MSPPVKHRDVLACLISNMEPKIRDLVRWGEVLECMGSSPHTIQPETVHVVGGAVRDLSREVEKEWEELFRLSHSGSEP